MTETAKSTLNILRTSLNRPYAIATDKKWILLAAIQSISVVDTGHLFIRLEGEGYERVDANHHDSLRRALAEYHDPLRNPFQEPT